jgi:hypothetical protein
LCSEGNSVVGIGGGVGGGGGGGGEGETVAQRLGVDLGYTGEGTQGAGTTLKRKSKLLTGLQLSVVLLHV